MLDRNPTCPRCRAGDHARCLGDSTHGRTAVRTCNCKRCVNKQMKYDPESEQLYREADWAGRRAAEEAVPVPMVVYSPKDPLGSLLGEPEEIDPAKPVYYVDEGVCGFAWVNVKPGTSRFARWLKSHGHARSDSYYGGVTLWVHDYGQSMARKAAYAEAFAAVLVEHGVKAYADSRMD